MTSMGEERENAYRVALLCRRLGNLWSEEDVVEVEEEIPVEKMRECNLTLFGKIFSKPNVNFQALQSTMKKAWKLETVSCALLEPGFFSFTFNIEAEKKKVMEEGPWSFASNLLVLKQWVPNTPVHCYDFSKCDFWVHFLGIPPERTTETIIRNAASKLGAVKEIRPSLKTGKARVEIGLAASLKTGTFLNVGGFKLWVDFKYERLPNYCYSCGRIGHYMTYCTFVPYEESELQKTGKGKYGSWLKMEAMEFSPYWELFYGALDQNRETKETILETHTQISPPEKENGQKNRNSEDNMEGNSQNTLTLGETSTVQVGKTYSEKNPPLLLLEAPSKDLEKELMVSPKKKAKLVTKTPPSKKTKRYSLYGF